MDGSALPLRRTVLLSLAAGLSAAALIAIAAILTQSFDRTDARLVATSLGFSVFSALGAAGARARQRDGTTAALGSGTLASAAAGFVLLLAALWSSGSDSLWRTFGVVAVSTLAGSHACLVLAARRPDDSAVTSSLTTISVATGAFDAFLGALAIAGVVARVNTNYVRPLAVLVIVMLLTTVLPPILRRLADAQKPPPEGRLADARAPKVTPDGHAVELLAIARRLDELVPQAGQFAWRIEQEAAQLRRLASKPLD